MLRLIIPIGFVAYFLKLTGFCFSEPGYLSDATLILNVLQQEIARGDPVFQDASAYLRQRPDCCEVHRWNSTFMDGHFLNALFGRRFFEVSVRYPVAPEAGSEDPFYNAIYIMDCCGRYVPDRYGIGEKRDVEHSPPRPGPPRNHSCERNSQYKWCDR